MTKDGVRTYGGIGQVLKARYGLTLVTFMEQSDVGLQGLISFNEETGQLVITYRGSDDIADWMGNINYGLHAWPQPNETYRQASDRLEELKMGTHAYLQMEDEDVGEAAQASINDVPQVMDGTLRQFCLSKKFIDRAMDDEGGLVGVVSWGGRDAVTVFLKAALVRSDLI